MDRVARSKFESDPEGIIRHLERALGPIASGSRARGVDFQVVVFEDQPSRHATTLATLGLSKHLLRRGQAILRQELLLSVNDELLQDLSPQSRLVDVAVKVERLHQPLTRGAVFGPAGPIAPGVTLEGFYCAPPFHFPDLSLFTEWDEPVEILSLLPLTPLECAAARRLGPDRFEELLFEQAPDFLDWRRAPIDLPSI
jgi:hypothetical protein